MTVELIIDAKATLGESPSWDESLQILYWVDIIGMKCLTYHPSTNQQKTIQFDQMVGAVAPKENRGLIIALENGFYGLDDLKETPYLIMQSETSKSGNRFNDGKCDPAGRFWAGTMSLNGDKEMGALYCLNLDLAVSKKLDRISISNGLAWSPDNKYMYYIDTPTQNVVKFDYDVETGEINNRQEIIAINPNEGYPDGMTIDQEGMLWIAHFGGGKVSRWDPTTGTHIQDVTVPALNVTSCVFGGEELNELYITTAKMGDDQHEYAGGLFRIKTDVKGSPTYQFKGDLR
ncbi:SMP-30/gluconolactonase/LRE family protein [Bacillus sp. JCM 19034]|uniref:SMP-30/gluconolactonase/LRE family protein n=1 Tax=Bacillus sp. JCM 19034 TaxID=1481928 RepID=UPI000AA09489|nr:SMP-30/gluconolactonase/LRE family protein [Bacillus sp. JCM 19034]